MGWGLGNVGGGGSLNLKLTAYSSEAELPQNAKENDIAVITDTPINKWTFSSTAPKNPVNGDLWITTGTASTVEMNIDRKNVILIYPIKCSQYVGGAWVNKIAKTWKNGKWSSWSFTIFDNGLTSYTFGTYGSAAAPQYKPSLNVGTVVKLTIPGWFNGTVIGKFLTNAKIDLTPFSRAVFDIEAQYNKGLACCIFNDSFEPVASTPYTSSRSIVNLDIRSLSGAYRVGAEAEGLKVNTGNIVTCYKILLEV